MILQEKNEVIAKFMGEKKMVDYSTDLLAIWPIVEKLSKLTKSQYRSKWYRFKIEFIDGEIIIKELNYHGLRWQYTSPKTEESLQYKLFDSVWAAITNLNKQEES